MPEDISNEIKKIIEDNNKTKNDYIFIDNENKIDGFKKYICLFRKKY